MILAWFKQKNLTVNVQKQISAWDVEHYSEEQIIKDMKWDIERKIKEEILKVIEVKVDQAIVQKLVDEMIVNYDFKKEVDEAIKGRLREYMGNLTAPKAPFMLDHQAYLLRHR